MVGFVVLVPPVFIGGSTVVAFPQFSFDRSFVVPVVVTVGAWAGSVGFVVPAAFTAGVFVGFARAGERVVLIRFELFEAEGLVRLVAVAREIFTSLRFGRCVEVVVGAQASTGACAVTTEGAPELSSNPEMV